VVARIAFGLLPVGETTVGGPAVGSPLAEPADPPGEDVVEAPTR
jgi:hypothetical protein